MRRFVVLTVLVLLVMAIAAPAHAGTPVKETQEVLGFGYLDFFSCEFDIYYETDFTSTVWSYYDSDGNLVRWREHAKNHIQTWTNPTNGRVLTATGGGYLNEWNINNPSVSIFSGKSALITVPGEGVVLLDAGRVELNVELGEITVVGGRHDLFLGPFSGALGPEPFCNYLAG